LEKDKLCEHSLKKSRLAILMSDKVEIRAKKITSGKDGNYIMLKGSIHQDKITILNVNVPSDHISKYARSNS
jgi:hypothetical protein